MKNIAVFLADGFEEIEGLTVVDVLRRAGLPVKTVSIMGRREVTGSHQITVLADVLFEETSFEETAALVLPGGMPGTLNLGAHSGVTETVSRSYQEGKMVAAICAAPSVLGQLGILKGRRATCYPGFEEKMTGAVATGAKAEVSDNVITGKGMGAAIPFALALVGQLLGEEKAREVKEAIVYED